MWAPNATRVAVVGDFNSWDPTADLLSASRRARGSGRAHLTRAKAGDVYKFAITTSDGDVLEKADPFAFCTEVPPADRLGRVGPRLRVGRRRVDVDAGRGQRRLDAPMSVYEVHLGSWRRDPADPGRLLSYRELAEPLIDHVRGCGFTHVEFLPLMEHPFYGSWGYQSRPGSSLRPAATATPQELMALIDQPPSCRDRRDPRLGAVALSRATPSRSAASTARTCSSTPIPASASTRTGRA